MPRITLLLVVLLTLTSGCNAIVDGSGAPERDTYDVEEPVDPAETNDDLPSVLDGERGADRAFGGTGLDYANGSFSVYVTTTVADGNGTTTFTNDQWTRYGTDLERISLIDRQTGRSPLFGSESAVANESRVLEFWGNETFQAERAEYANGTVAFDDEFREGVTDGYRHLIMALTVIEEVDVERRGFGDETRYVAESTSPIDDSAYEDDGFNATVRIDAEDRVREVVLEGTLVEAGERRRVSQRIVVYDVDETSVERPAWVDEVNETDRSADE